MDIQQDLAIQLNIEIIEREDDLLYVLDKVGGKSNLINLLLAIARLESEDYTDYVHDEWSVNTGHGYWGIRDSIHKKYRYLRDNPRSIKLNAKSAVDFLITMIMKDRRFKRYEKDLGTDRAIVALWNPLSSGKYNWQYINVIYKKYLPYKRKRLDIDIPLRISMKPLFY